MKLVAELKRRNVIRVGIAYALIAWVVLQVVDFLVEVIDAPPWVLQVFVIAAAVGLLAVLIFAWVFEMTPEGIKRESEIDRSQSITPTTGRKLDRMIIVFLAVAVVVLVAERFWHPAAEKGTEAISTAEKAENASVPFSPTGDGAVKRSIAVLPFAAFSNGPDDEYFADGLTEEILNALAQLPELLVTARTSAFSFKGQDVPVQEIAAKLGVENVVEGSVRRSGDRLRVTAQLVRAEDGFHLWSETYDSTSQDAIQVQEDIAVQIARVLDVILDESRREAMRESGLRDVEAFIAFQKGIEGFVNAHGTDDQVAALLEANRFFEQVLERVPGYPPAHVQHADAYVHLFTDVATGDTQGANYGMDAETAFRQAVADYTAAADNARSFHERTAMEFDLAATTGRFADMHRRLEQAITAASESCIDPVWLDQVAMIFGYAGPMREATKRVVACDPLRVTERFSLARLALWDGDAQGALDEVQSARDDGLAHPWLDMIEVQANIALGRFETASGGSGFALNNTGIRRYTTTILAAARGDRQQAEKFLQSESAEYTPGNFFLLQLFAQLGDRKAANQLAATIDANSLSPIPLFTIISWCGCGAPFDLENTPNFAARLAEGELPWPPPTAIRFPLKDW